MNQSSARVMALAATITLTGCAASPYDFPVPTMIGQEQGYSMTGFIKGDNDAIVRERLPRRVSCPNGVDFVSLRTQRADNAVGTHILHYDAVMKCRSAPSSSSAPD